MTLHCEVDSVEDIITFGRRKSIQHEHLVNCDAWQKRAGFLLCFPPVSSEKMDTIPPTYFLFGGYGTEWHWMYEDSSMHVMRWRVCMVIKNCQTHHTTVRISSNARKFLSPPKFPRIRSGTVLWAESYNDIPYDSLRSIQFHPGYGKPDLNFGDNRPPRDRPSEPTNRVGVAYRPDQS